MPFALHPEYELIRVFGKVPGTFSPELKKKLSYLVVVWAAETEMLYFGPFSEPNPVGIGSEVRIGICEHVGWKTSPACRIYPLSQWPYIQVKRKIFSYKYRNGKVHICFLLIKKNMWLGPTGFPNFGPLFSNIATIYPNFCWTFLTVSSSRSLTNDYFFFIFRHLLISIF